MTEHEWPQVAKLIEELWPRFAGVGADGQPRFPREYQMAVLHGWRRFEVNDVLAALRAFRADNPDDYRPKFKDVRIGLRGREIPSEDGELDSDDLLIKWIRRGFRERGVDPSHWTDVDLLKWLTYSAGLWWYWRIEQKRIDNLEAEGKQWDGKRLRSDVQFRGMVLKPCWDDFNRLSLRFNSKVAA